MGLILVVALCSTFQASAESSLEKWLRVLGISVIPQTKGPGDEMSAGDIWVAMLSGNMTRQRLTFDGGYRSPVFLSDDRTILALKDDSVVRLSVFGGEPEKGVAVPGVMRLIGVSAKNPNEVLMLTDDADGRTAAGVLSLTDGRIAILAMEMSPDERGTINRLKNWDQVYDNMRLTVEVTTEQGLSGPRTWSNVYMTRTGQSKQNLSRCEDVDCGQPSLSHDKTRVAYIKADRS